MEELLIQAPECRQVVRRGWPTGPVPKQGEGGGKRWDPQHVWPMSTMACTVNSFTWEVQNLCEESSQENTIVN